MKLNINKEKVNKEKILNNFYLKLYIHGSSLSFNNLSDLFLLEGGNATNNKTLKTLQRMIEKISIEKHREVFNLKENLIVKTVFDDFLLSFCGMFNTYSEIIKVEYDLNSQSVDFKNNSYEDRKKIEEIIKNIAPIVIELWLSMLDSLSKGETHWLKSEYKLEYNGEIEKEINAFFYTDRIEINRFLKENNQIKFYRQEIENAAIKFLEELGEKSIPSKFFKLKDKDLSYRKFIEKLNCYKFYKIERIELNEENAFCYLPEKDTGDFLIPIYGKISFETFIQIFDGLDDGYDRQNLSQKIEIY